MVDSADEPPLSSRLHSWAKNKGLQSLNPFRSSNKDPDHDPANTLPQHVGQTELQRATSSTTADNHSHQQDTEQKNPSVVDTSRDGETPAAIAESNQKAPVTQRFIRDVKRIICASWINWLLVFVPAGIILGAIEDWGGQKIVSPSVIFALNAIAIIPLASLLAFATESVASKLGDTIGALLNVTFGNAVEIIVFVLALVAKEVRIVQAATLGSILSNLLLILGMCFLFGGLRFREQIYNPSISQMSACLLSLSVLSLLLPTAFHAAFSDNELADRIVLKVSRGTSVILLLVYGIYLIFQLKSHAFMYESTPQHVIDEESHPGVLAEMMNSSSSSSDDSSSSSSESDSSHHTAGRIKRALRRKRRRSVSSKDQPPSPMMTRTDTVNSGSSPTLVVETNQNGDEADDESAVVHRGSSQTAVQSHDFETQSNYSAERKRKHRKRAKKAKGPAQTLNEKAEITMAHQGSAQPTVPQVHVQAVPEIQEATSNEPVHRPFHFRHISSTIKPAFNSTVFPHHEAVGRTLAIPNARPVKSLRPLPDTELRRTLSMPDIRRQQSPAGRPASPHPRFVALDAPTEIKLEDVVDTHQHLSRTSSVILLLCTTGLVALCAEFLVGSIDYMVETSGVSQAFIGLIILPIVGNAAEHVTAVTVAYKNKMDLAINIALGSSIQIALFVTPLMVMLGWALNVEMSLYFSLFETVSLFASAFIVNYLMIDGRSNYLEGTLLIAAYLIIAIAAFFYPQCGLSAAGGLEDAASAVC